MQNAASKLRSAPHMASSFTYKMTVAYDGSRFGGWQVQPNAVSIQALIEQALTTILRTPSSIFGSGRTDAGVHAKGQVAHFSAPQLIDAGKVLASLNGLLPAEVRILSLEEAAADFHARFSATSKVYHYRLHTSSIHDPFELQYKYQVPHPVDLSLLKEAATYFLGTHDFTSFANESHKGTASHDPVRTLYRLDVVEEAQGIRLEFHGDGFLYKMVRNIVGTLLDICAGKIEKDQLPTILAAKDRKQAGRSAPPHGLCLMQVNY